MNLVDIYIDDLPEMQRDIVIKIRELLFEIVPNIQEKYSFKLPFYHYFGMFCFINKVPNGIDVCFCRGQDLLDEFPQLLPKQRRLVASIELFCTKDIEDKQVPQIISMAAIWNEEAKKLGISVLKKSK